MHTVSKHGMILILSVYSFCVYITCLMIQLYDYVGVMINMFAYLFLWETKPRNVRVLFMKSKNSPYQFYLKNSLSGKLVYIAHNNAYR